MMSSLTPIPIYTLPKKEDYAVISRCSSFSSSNYAVVSMWKPSSSSIYTLPKKEDYAVVSRCSSFSSSNSAVVSMWKPSSSSSFSTLSTFSSSFPSFAVTQRRNLTAFSSNPSFNLLSIDGGGVRGAIPATCLVLLENELQKLDGPDARIVSYFDAISETSSGAIIACLLAFPGEIGPKFRAQDIQKNFIEHASTIFQRSFFHPYDVVRSTVRSSIYQQDGLRNLLEAYMGDTTLRQALTKLIIPTMEIKGNHLKHFSSYEESDLDNKLMDICLASCNFNGIETEYNMIDGGGVKNNPLCI